MRKILLALVAALMPLSLVHAQVTVTPEVTKTDIAQVQSDLAAAKASSDLSVKTVNGNAPTAGNVAVATTSFVSGFTSASPGTVATLMSNAPCNSTRLGSYAVVSDLYGNIAGSSTNEVLRCGVSGTIYYWRPQRTDYSATMTYTGGAMTLNPLFTPPVLYLTGTVTQNGMITPSTTYAYPGQQFTVVQVGLLGLFSVQVGGLLGGLLNTVTGGTRTLTYSCDASAVCGWRGN